MLNPISKEEFAYCPQGTSITDSNGNNWIFTDNAYDIPGDPIRILKSPKGELEVLSHVSDKIIAMGTSYVVPELNDCIMNLNNHST